MRSAKTFYSSGRRRPHLENGAVMARARSGGGATGVLADRTRILAIASRKRIVPSARGPRKIRRHSATATRQVSARRRLEALVTSDRDRISRAAIDRGAANRLASDRRNPMGANRGRIDLRPRTIARGRPSRPDRALSENPGLHSHLMIDPGERSRPASHLATIADRGMRPGELRAAIADLMTSSVHGAQSRERASLPMAAVKSRFRNVGSVRTVRPRRACVDAATMSRPIAIEARGRLSERRQ